MDTIALVCVVCGVAVDKHVGQGHNFMVRDDQGYDASDRPGHFKVINYRVVTIAAPAAGADPVIVVPANSNWRIEALLATLVTDAVVNNRVPHLIVDDGQGHNLFNVPFANNQVAGSTVIYSAGASIVASSFDNAITACFPQHLLLLQGWRVRMATSLLDAGDQWSATNVLIKEWLQF
jgi:hypothetical protein